MFRLNPNLAAVITAAAMECLAMAPAARADVVYYVYTGSPFTEQFTTGTALDAYNLVGWRIDAVATLVTPSPNGNFYWYGGDGIVSIDISLLNHAGDPIFNQLYYGHTYSDNGSNSEMTLVGVNGGSVVQSFFGVVAPIDGESCIIQSQWNDPIMGSFGDELGDEEWGSVIADTTTPGTWSGPFPAPEPSSLFFTVVSLIGLGTLKRGH